MKMLGMHNWHGAQVLRSESWGQWWKAQGLGTAGVRPRVRRLESSPPGPFHGISMPVKKRALVLREQGSEQEPHTVCVCSPWLPDDWIPGCTREQSCPPNQPIALLTLWHPYCFGVAVRRQGLTLQPQLDLNSKSPVCLSFLKAGHWCKKWVTTPGYPAFHFTKGLGVSRSSHVDTYSFPHIG